MLVQLSSMGQEDYYYIILQTFEYKPIGYFREKHYLARTQWMETLLNSEQTKQSAFIFRCIIKGGHQF